MIAALDALFAQYPANERGRYPRDSHGNFHTVNERRQREYLMQYAGTGVPEDIMARRYYSGVPPDLIAAAVALIYG